MMPNVPIMRPNRAPPVDTSDMQYNQSLGAPPLGSQHVMPMPPNYYERSQGYKRKGEFANGPSYRTDKMMRTNYGMVHATPKEEYEGVGMGHAEKSRRHYNTSGSSADPPVQKVFDRHSLGSNDGEYPAAMLHPSHLTLLTRTLPNPC